MTTEVQLILEFAPLRGRTQSTHDSLLHLIGTSVGIAARFIYCSGRWWLFPLGLIPGYGAAWIGHFLSRRTDPQLPTSLVVIHGRLQNDLDDACGKMGAEVKRVATSGKK